MKLWAKAFPHEVACEEVANGVDNDDDDDDQVEEAKKRSVHKLTVIILHEKVSNEAREPAHVGADPGAARLAVHHGHHDTEEGRNSLGEDAGSDEVLHTGGSPRPAAVAQDVRELGDIQHKCANATTAQIRGINDLW